MIWVKNATTRKELPRLMHAIRRECRGIIAALVIKSKGWRKTAHVLSAAIAVGDVQSASLYVHQTQIEASSLLINISSSLLLNRYGH
jgi:hypothetical protein